jgi:hypothetical protein
MVERMAEAWSRGHPFSFGVGLTIEAQLKVSLMAADFLPAPYAGNR